MPKHHYWLYAALLAAGFWWGCTPQEQDLAGNWRAVAFYEDGQSVTAPLDSVGLQLSADGGYEFRSQGYYRESGSYRCSMFYLFLTDTLSQPVKEHTVKVLYVSADTLKIRMSNDDREQVLFFARNK